MIIIILMILYNHYLFIFTRSLDHDRIKQYFIICLSWIYAFYDPLSTCIVILFNILRSTNFNNTRSSFNGKMSCLFSPLFPKKYATTVTLITVKVIRSGDISIVSNGSYRLNGICSCIAVTVVTL